MKPVERELTTQHTPLARDTRSGGATCTMRTFLKIASILTALRLNPANSFTPPKTHPRPIRIRANLFSKPSTTATRDKQAISSVKSAFSLPSPTFLEVEFPPLVELNKLGDGSLRSSLEAEDANIAFVAKLVGEVAVPLIGRRVSVLVSSSASGSFLGKVRSRVKGGDVYSMKDVTLDMFEKKEVCVVLTPSSGLDYRVARELAEAGYTTVIVNGLFKDPKSIPPYAKMAYYQKPLTYNSQVAGYLIRQYPNPWTVTDTTNKVLGKFSDDEILVEKTNTPDLRSSVRLVQKSFDERAIKARGSR